MCRIHNNRSDNAKMEMEKTKTWGGWISIIEATINKCRHTEVPEWVKRRRN
jgi:hypothetical protein